MKIALVFGGRSAEHEVSVTSARCIWEAMKSKEDKSTADSESTSAELVPIGIDKKGRWWLLSDVERQFKAGEMRYMEGDYAISIEPASGLLVEDSIIELDVVFPILHGTFGEDGSIQGLFEMIGIPYVGAGVMGSSVAMDKGLARAAFAANGLLQPDYTVFAAYQWKKNYLEITAQINDGLDFPLFVKPCNLGSSVGISKVTTPAKLDEAIEFALRFDNRVIVESSIEDCSEVECGVIGNEEVEASSIGEIIPGDKFYSYDDKYINKTSQTVIPAKLEKALIKQVREDAVKAYMALGIEGLARVDFFVRGSNVYINEINTLPGFTPISMFPQLWEYSGLGYRQLVLRLCDLALQRFNAKSALITERND